MKSRMACLCVLFVGVGMAICRPLHAAPPFNLETAIATAHPGQTIEVPTGTYTVSSMVIKTTGLTIKGNGSTLILSDPYSVFDVRAPHVTIDGFECAKSGVFVIDEGDNCTLSNCNLGCDANGKATSPDGSIEAAFKTQAGGTNAKMIGCKVGKTMTVGFYADQDGPQLTNCIFYGCLKEYNWRLELDVHGVTHSGAVFTNDVFFATDGSKDGGGARQFKNCLFKGCTFYKDLRLGQEPPASEPPTTSIGEYVTATLDSCVFLDQEVIRNSAGEVMSGLCSIQCYQGVMFTVTNCTFTLSGLPAINVGYMSQCNMKNDVMKHADGDKSEMVAKSSTGKSVEMQ